MSDLFDAKNIKPMLIGQEGEAFDSKDYIYELKLDGERCIKTLKVDIPCDIVYVALPKLLLILYDKQIDLTISKNQLFHSSNIFDHFCIHNNIYHRWLEANHKRSDHIFRCL